MILGNLTEHTIFQYVFGTAKALFIVFYLILSLKNAIINVTLENLNLTVDLTTLYIVATLLSLLGFARVLLQLINFINERSEATIQPLRQHYAIVAQVFAHNSHSPAKCADTPDSSTLTK